MSSFNYGTQMNADYHDFLIMLKEKFLYSAISYFNLNNYYLRLSASQIRVYERKKKNC
jgi:hypothetical protein